MRSAVYPFPEKRQRQACERDPCGEVWGGPNQGASPYQPGNFQLRPGPITSSSLEINALKYQPLATPCSQSDPRSLTPGPLTLPSPMTNCSPGACKALSSLWIDKVYLWRGPETSV